MKEHRYCCVFLPCQTKKSLGRLACSLNQRFPKFAAPLLRHSSNAAIVNIASTRAFMSEPHNEAYATAKEGLLGLTHALANSLGPAGRVGLPDDTLQT